MMKSFLLFFILLVNFNYMKADIKRDDIKDAFKLFDHRNKETRDQIINPLLKRRYNSKLQEENLKTDKIIDDNKISTLVDKLTEHFHRYRHHDSGNNGIEPTKKLPSNEMKLDIRQRKLDKKELTMDELNMGSDENIPSICDLSRKRKSILLISTLDGQLTAIDYNSGNVLWSSAVGRSQTSLISSSLSKVDITSNGQWMRLIPSLDGAIYKFDGENITPLPINADILLHSSYKFNEDTVISGGKASEVVGIDPETGEVKYSCSKEGCVKSPEPTDSSLLVITKESKIVRAVDLKSGNERWNFSVAQHFTQVVQAACLEPDCDYDDDVKRIQFVVPEGLLNAEGCCGGVWKQKMASPIVSAWKVTDYEAEQLDLFSNVSVPALISETSSAADSGASLYIGYHKEEFYVQESLSFKNKVTSYGKDEPSSSYTGNLPTLKWRPFKATTVSKTPVVFSDDNNRHPLMIGYETKQRGDDADSDDNYLVEEGVYLFDDEDEVHPRRRRFPFSFLYKNKSFEECPINNLELICEKFEKGVFNIHTFLGLLVIGCFSFSCTCWFRLPAIRTLIMLVLSWFFNKIFRLLQRAGVDLHVPTTTSGSKSGQQSEYSSVRIIEPIDRRISENSDTSAHIFTSRLCSEFTAIECLGKGGFGYVFNAQHKVDATNYALKRIKLRNRESSKVMREVYALAKLQHPHIVRYFSSWIETPPMDWQSPFDALLNNKDQSFDPDNWENTESASCIAKPSPKIGAMNSVSCDFTFGNSQSMSGVDSSSSNELSDSFSKGDDSSSIIFEDSSRIGATFAGVSQSDGRDESQSRRLAYSSYKGQTITSDVHSKRRSSSVRSESENVRTYLYIQMELCMQTTLREWLEENCIRDKLKILHTFNDIVHAVEYIHDQNLIHRDLKPSNIFFSNNGNVKVGDFGLVTSIVDDVSQKMTEASILMAKRTVKAGTELYMSPEQKEKRRYNHKVDIFSLGIIFYEMLVPFGTEMERRVTLMKVRQREFSEEFQTQYPNECLILNQTLNENADLRPTTRGLRCLQPLADLQTDLHQIESEERYVLRTISHRKRLNSSKEHILI